MSKLKGVRTRRFWFTDGRSAPPLESSSEQSGEFEIYKLGAVGETEQDGACEGPPEGVRSPPGRVGDKREGAARTRRAAED